MAYADFEVHRRTNCCILSVVVVVGGGAVVVVVVFVIFYKVEFYFYGLRFTSVALWN